MVDEEIRAALAVMEKDPSFATKSTYNANSLLWPDNRMPFIEVHMAYIKGHPKIDPKQYLSNLRLRSRQR